MRDLATVGREMRIEQRKFFNHEPGASVPKAKQLEREFDAILRAMDAGAVPAEQPSLLDQREQSREDVFDAIDRERHYQDRKWGNKHLTVGEEILLVHIELHEAGMAFGYNAGDADARRELLDVAAIVVRCLENHGVVERAPA